MNLADYWAAIDAQADAVRTATTTADVLRICPTSPGMSSGDGFWHGEAGDMLTALQEAGWSLCWIEADYYWCAHHGDDHIGYVEGDLYASHQRPLSHEAPADEPPA